MLVFLALVLLPSSAIFIGDLQFALRMITAAESVFIVYVLITIPRTGWNSRVSTLLLLMMVILFCQGTLVGATHAVANINSWSKWAEYTLLALFWVLGLQAGQRLMGYLEARSVALLVFFLALGDVGLMIPRVAVLGLDIRSPFGTTIWAPFLVVLILTSRSSFRAVISFIVLLAAIVAALVSGMRSSALLTFGGMAFAAAYLGWHRVIVHGRLVACSVILALKIVSFIVLAPNIVELVHRNVTLVQSRLQGSILSAEIVLDEGGMGREREAQIALTSFNENSGLLQKLVGVGHGFVYSSDTKDSTAHIHITPVAFYVRYGLVGLVSYSILFIWVLQKAFVSFWQKWTEYNAYIFAIRIAATLLVVGSVVAGFLVQPLSWVVIGMAVGRCNANRSIKPERYFRNNVGRKRIYGYAHRNL